MSIKKAVFSLFILQLFSCNLFCQTKIDDSKFISFIVNPMKNDLRFFWKDSNGEIYSNFEKLKNTLAAENKDLIFAMNGGMYLEDQSPQGLYIENGELLQKIDLADSGYGNFYMQPNGIFYIANDNVPHICTTFDFVNKGNIKFATQSGPMLLIDGKIHHRFIVGSKYLNIRNGVGILPDGNVLFAMSKEEINFYDFATYFKNKGCRNALYLDGHISRAFLPEENWEQFDSNFGVIIGVIKHFKNK